MNSDYFEFNTEKRGLNRYLWCLRKTYNVFKGDYQLIFVQNPSIFLALFAVMLKVFFRRIVVIDAHNAGVYPKENKYPLLTKVNFLILRYADFVIVTNQPLVKMLEGYGIKAFEFTDPLPDISFSSNNDLRKEYVFIICSWAEDEPIELYLDTARQMPSTLFKITGNYHKYTNDLTNIPSNVELLGFIDKNEYESSLVNSSLVLDLTNRQDCLVCGAYEAISACRPVVLTDNEVNRKVFKNIALYSKLDVHSLKNAVLTGISTDEHNVENFKYEYMKSLEDKSRVFLENIPLRS